MSAVSSDFVPDDTLTFDDDVAAEPAPRMERFLSLALEGARPMAPGLRIALAGVRRVIVGRGTPRALLDTEVATELRLDIPDPQLSREHAAIQRGPEGWELCDLGSKNGSFLNGAEVATMRLAAGDVMRLGGSFLVFREALVPASTVIGSVDLAAWPQRSVFDAVNVDLAMAFDGAARIASAPVSILLRGETGTGKELVALELHRRSGRAGNFVALNCGAIAENLIESELFGHRKGAFSGAAGDKKGMVEEAEGGTLFLDEVAELSESAQVTLLRVLQEREVRRVGCTRNIKVDFRVIAATHQDLEAQLESGRFRRDLYARLAGYTINLLPLRQRTEDLGAIIATLLPTIVEPRRARRIRLSPKAARALVNYGYPLNIRELEQALRAAIALSTDDTLRDRHFPEHISVAATITRPGLSPEDRETRDRLERLLRETRGNVSATARAMGKAPVQIRRWCRRFAIDVAEYRGR